jgi:hypothetical protein
MAALCVMKSAYQPSALLPEGSQVPAVIARAFTGNGGSTVCDDIWHHIALPHHCQKEAECLLASHGILTSIDGSTVCDDICISAFCIIARRKPSACCHCAALHRQWWQHCM